MSFIGKVKNRIFPSKQAQRVKPWFKVNGDKTLRLDYDLNQHSIVFDLGGYEGQWASDIFSKYVCPVFIFEPYIKYAEKIKERFRHNGKIKVFAFGLGKIDEQLTLYESDDASSVYKKKGKAYTIEIKKASSFIRKQAITKIDLMKINIEGGEYDLLEELLDEGMVNNIVNLQIQFHDFVDRADERMKRIQQRLSATHTLSYQYEYVWENWVLTK